MPILTWNSTHSSPCPPPFQPAIILCFKCPSPTLDSEPLASGVGFSAMWVPSTLSEWGSGSLSIYLPSCVQTTQEVRFEWMNSVMVLCGCLCLCLDKKFLFCFFFKKMTCLRVDFPQHISVCKHPETIKWIAVLTRAVLVCGGEPRQPHLCPDQQWGHFCPSYESWLTQPQGLPRHDPDPWHLGCEEKAVHFSLCPLSGRHSFPGALRSPL